MLNIPLSLYIHIPFCLRKCPYCDFNSYQNTTISEAEYLEALLHDFDSDLSKFDCKQRKLQSIFIGGGTPSLFSANIIEKILDAIANKFHFDSKIEITIEANPGTLDLQKCNDYKLIGINRISLGVQSFIDTNLQALGRIHSSKEANTAIKAIIDSGIDNFNLDIMFGLPGQTLTSAMQDLLQAISFNPTHISWYQLTLEADTVFARNPPLLPQEDIVAMIQEEGEALLTENYFTHYEISAYSKSEAFQCRHNLNYWGFGDYLGIGAGAHGKVTQNNSIDDSPKQIIRYVKKEYPADYISSFDDFIKEQKSISEFELPFEFMLNALRLYKKIPFSLFQQRTFLNINSINDKLYKAKQLGLIKINQGCIETTKNGKKFLNDLLEVFL